MGVNITSSSRAELEFEECPYCHSDSAAKYEYITAATGAWVVVKYTCLKCASQFIYDCRALRPNPILVQGAGGDWLRAYTTESEMWRDRLGYKRIEKPKEESMGWTEDCEKFKQPAGSIVEFEGESYVVRSDEAGLVTCDRCDLLGVCSINNWPELCEEGKYYKKVKESDMILAKDVCKFAVDEFDEKVGACNIGDTMELNGKTYKAVDQAPYDEGCYNCDLCELCQDLHFDGEFCEVCNPNVIFKEAEQKEEVNDDVAIFHDYSKDPFEKLFRFNTGFKFRYGNKMYEAADIKELGVDDFSCGNCCDLVDYCYDEDGCYRSEECPGHRYFKEVCTAGNNVNDKKEQLSMSNVVYNGVVDFKKVFTLPIGSVFRKGDRLIRVVESDNPGDCADCRPCALSRECTERGEDGYVCPAARWYKDIGCAYTYAPCCCQENGLAATINAKEGSTDGVTSRSIVADLKMNCDVLTLDATQLGAIIDNSRVFCKCCGKTYGTVKQHVASITAPSNFLDDGDKLVDFFKLTKEEFLKSYSYLTEEEYEATKDAINKKMSK